MAAGWLNHLLGGKPEKMAVFCRVRDKIRDRLVPVVRSRV
jgi:hypothetical protein